MFQLLDPAGSIALSERGLMFHAILLMLIVVVPLFILAFTIAWRYREGNTKAVYTPDWEHSKMEEFIWWIIPFEIILVLGALTWSSTHQLDPFKPLVSNTPPLTVDVVALDWKWLFIYPSLGIATVNELNIPVNTPVVFDITADAPMNSFWIPQLGGQIYAMPGMVTQLHLEATETGSFQGSSANYSGDGFAQMKFKANALSETDFTAWTALSEHATGTLDNTAYATLAAPSSGLPVAVYGSVDKNLYNTIVTHNMSPVNTAEMEDK